jgi:hypothetical protein
LAQLLWKIQYHESEGLYKGEGDAPCALAQLLTALEMATKAGEGLEAPSRFGEEESNAAEDEGFLETGGISQTALIEPTA